jgi:hypothetical protein
MEENKLIKYDNKQLDKIRNIIAITDKLLGSSINEEPNNSESDEQTTDRQLLAMLAIKKQVLKLRRDKEQRELLSKEKERKKEKENQDKTRSFDERIDTTAEEIIEMLKKKGYE